MSNPNYLNSVQQYEQSRHKYIRLCDETKRILVSAFLSNEIPHHTVEARAKTVESFKKKAELVNQDGSLKYDNPLSQITDLSGVRIITYTLRDVQVVCEFIVDHFKVKEKKDIGEERWRTGKFGYQSIHFLVEYPEARIALPDFAAFASMTCEIQVRTVLQHAWAEIEHDIQYKNQAEVPRLLQRKFTALAGLLEIADREFQTIQDEDRSLKQSVTDSLQEDLTRDAISKKANQEKTDSNGESPIKNVRQLIKQGKFTDAIQVYNERIDVSPAMHTLYLGRAKAKFLVGDQSSALVDVETALSLSPDDPAAITLRNQFVEGHSLSKSAIPVQDHNDLTRQGHEHLEAGDGVSAFECYSLAQENGGSRPFSIYYKASACLIAEDFDGARYLLGSLEIRNGTPMGVNIVALYCLIYAFSDLEKFASEFEKLNDHLKTVGNYLFAVSPLPRLRDGLIKSHFEKSHNEGWGKAEAVFTALQEGK